MRWAMMEAVDVVMLTKNSERLLRQSLVSVYKNVPVDNLIIVDGYSTDRTVEIVKEFQEEYGNVILIAQQTQKASSLAQCTNLAQYIYIENLFHRNIVELLRQSG
jgi:glycosyltransferase involved in cell wall biosynthesis